jgi:ATP-dependent DNA helicase PIF1
LTPKKQTLKKKVVSPKAAAVPTIVLTREFKTILDILDTTTKSVFITGKAGTGKSTLLRYFTKHTEKKFVVLAPTGVAALNVGGQTIHSFFRFPPAFIEPDEIKRDPHRSRLFKNLDMVIIDEVSMVRADLMEGIDIALRKNRNKPKEPFGGVQMVFIGDLFQLSPVLKDYDIESIEKEYGGQYFFDAKAFKKFTYHFEELTTIFRQSPQQQQFKKLLNGIRNNKAQPKDMALLNAKHTSKAGQQRNGIFLTTRRDIARDLNMAKLEKLPGKPKKYTAEVIGEYAKLLELGENRLDDKFPAPYTLQLKKGAQVMMNKNDAGKQWVNGSVGKIVKLEKNVITVEINGRNCKVGRELWKEVEYTYNSAAGEIQEQVVSTYVQFPLQLSYAITIHKSQGKTFDKITIDTGTGAFAHGQIYVALSRCTTLEGIRLNKAIRKSDIIVDPRIISFYNTRTIPAQTPIEPRTPKVVPAEILSVIKKAVKKKYAVKVKYENYDGIKSIRRLSNLSFNDEYGYEYRHLNAYCHKRKSVRTFNMTRITTVKIVE